MKDLKIIQVAFKMSSIYLEPWIILKNNSKTSFNNKIKQAFKNYLVFNLKASILLKKNNLKEAVKNWLLWKNYSSTDDI